MKKLLAVILVVSLALLGSIALIGSVRAGAEISIVMKIGEKKYMVNGVEREMDVAPFIENGRTLVPIRFVIEALGGEVGWDGVLRKVTVKIEGKTIELFIGKKEVYVNGKKMVIDVAPKIVPPGRTMVPLRFISETAGYFVFYDAFGRQVYIQSKLIPRKIPGVTDKEIKIGAFAALSGPVAPIGIEFVKGYKTYYNYINDNGGIYGRKIKLIVEDDQFNPAKTIAAVKRMVEVDKVFAIVGGLGTPGCLAVMDYLNENKVPFVYQGSGSSKLAYPPKKYIFAVQPNFTNEGQIMAKYVVEELKADKIAVIYETDDIGTEGLNGVKKGLEKYGKKPVIEVGFSPTEVDLTSYVLKLKQAKPDVVIMYALLKPASIILKTAYSLGLKTKFVTTYPNADPLLITLAGKEAAEGTYVSAWVFTDLKDPGVKKFYEIWDKYHPGEIPSAYAIAGWIAGEVFVEGLRRAGSPPTRERLVWALETFKHWSGMLAKDITYAPNDRSGKKSMYFMQVKDGMWTKVSDWISIGD
ncbi:MAG: ABC transporter substrate-binding protein [Caldisericia bacterium]|nr:ABC transporter substrate-binding protein [Caldisericia bacterium]